MAGARLMKSKSHQVLLLQQLLLVVLGPMSVVLAQVTCTTATALARSYLNQLVQGCQTDRSACDAETTCSNGNCIVGDESFGATCNDGCSYTLGDYTVERSTDGVTARAYALNNPINLNYAGFRNTYTRGPAVANVDVVGLGIDYSFEASLDTSSGSGVVIRSAVGSSCNFILYDNNNNNRNECSCEQFYCDDNQNRGLLH